MKIAPEKIVSGKKFLEKLLIGNLLLEDLENDLEKSKIFLKKLFYVYNLLFPGNTNQWQGTPSFDLTKDTNNT